ncbi:response regulator transcription factor, partial [Escherichia coli]|nr:response regulator transcription factor [Escherichia coli]
PGFTVLAEAENGETAILMVREHRPDVLLLDLMMPGMGDAAEAMIGHIRKASPETHIMILTSSDDDRLAFKAIEAGAHSFLLKSMRGEHLMNA